MDEMHELFFKLQTTFNDEYQTAIYNLLSINEIQEFCQKNEEEDMNKQMKKMILNN